MVNTNIKSPWVGFNCKLLKNQLHKGFWPRISPLLFGSVNLFEGFTIVIEYPSSDHSFSVISRAQKDPKV